MSTQLNPIRKIRIIEHISLDGVIQGPGGPNEDGYAHGGWAVPHADPALGEAINAAHGEGLDLLLGRRTYDIWSDYWPKAEKGPLADILNAATKYVATHRQTLLFGWNPATRTRARRHEGCVLGRHHQHLQAQPAFADRLLRRRCLSRLQRSCRAALDREGESLRVPPPVDLTVSLITRSILG